MKVVRSRADLFGTPQSHTTQDANTWTGLPVVFDEVFTGLYRLGRFSSASFLQVHPDISAHAKLLTGGLVPLCTTVASESIYQTFLGTEKRDALLHGHSYTAHPVGCHVANVSLDMMLEMEHGESWQPFRHDWQGPMSRGGGSGNGAPVYAPSDVWSSWSKGFVERISHSPEVESVIALGSVLAINLQDVNAGKSPMS